MRASNQPRPYQGYPYVEPPVHDAPSIDQATASRWANLPRKQISLNVGRENPVVYIDLPDGHADAEARNDSVSLPRKDDPEPVVYIDLPETSGSLVSEERVLDEPSPSTHRDENKRDPDAEPVVYIDLPDDTGSVTHTSLSHTARDDEPEFVQHRDENKRDPDTEPVVYIDLPDDTGSVTHTSLSHTTRDKEPEFVQETIFFDPFENRRIEMHKEERESESEDDTVSTVSGQSHRHRAFRPPVRPNTLDLYGAGSSGGASSSPAASSAIPAHLSKETLIYGQTNEDGFPMSPIPVSEFPEPPPAYAEIDRVSSPVVEPVVEQPRREEPPRTQVILPRDHVTTPMGVPNPDRKYLNCHHCGMRVHTLVVRENGTITHVTAAMCLTMCMLPVVAFIYCTDYMKIKNHYCPNCNKIISYELPFRDNKMIYVN